MIKIDIFSGFLGSGKTTLIKKLISDCFADEKVVLIENEFGEINVDSGFLKESGIEITEMSSGCICCTLVGDFGVALRDVVTKFEPDRILIEPSGVGKLSEIITAVMNVAADMPVALNNFVTVADAKKCKMYAKNFGEFYLDQIENAKTVILSRTQDMTPERLDAAVKVIRDNNSFAKIITTPWDQLTGTQILEAMEGEKTFEAAVLEEVKHEHHHHEEHECCCGHDHEHEHHHHDDHECCCGHDHEHEHHHHDDHECSCGCGHDHVHHHHHADEVFASWGVETPRKYTKAEIEEILEELDEGMYGAVLRAKGIVPCEDGTWLHFDYVPGESEIREGAPSYTGQICVIGAELKQTKLPALFHLA